MGGWNWEQHVLERAYGESFHVQNYIVSYESIKLANSLIVLPVNFFVAHLALIILHTSYLLIASLDPEESDTPISPSPTYVLHRNQKYSVAKRYCYHFTRTSQRDGQTAEFLTKQTTCASVLLKKTTSEKDCQKRPPSGGGTPGQATRGTCRLAQSRHGGAATPEAGNSPDGDGR
jgi:hypothetical protein